MGRGEGRDGEWDGVGKGGREGKEGMGGGREGTPLVLAYTLPLYMKSCIKH